MVWFTAFNLWFASVSPQQTLCICLFNMWLFNCIDINISNHKYPKMKHRYYTINLITWWPKSKDGHAKTWNVSKQTTTWIFLTREISWQYKINRKRHNTYVRSGVSAYVPFREFQTFPCFKPPSIFILTVPGRYFCCGSLLFLLSVFILWFIYYVSDIFCIFKVAEWLPIWERAVHSVCRECLS